MATGNSMEDELRRRISDLESALAHHQHAFDGLNAVVIEQAKMLDGLQHYLRRLEATMQDVREQLPAEPRDPLAEKPPHY